MNPSRKPLQLDHRCLYLVIGKLEKGRADYLPTLLGNNPQDIDPYDQIGCLDERFDGYYYDLWYHNHGNIGTLYRISFNDIPQLMERRRGYHLETEGPPALKVYPQVTNVAKSPHVVGLVKIFHLSNVAQKVIETNIEYLTPSLDTNANDLVPSVKNWTLGLINKMDKLLNKNGFVNEESEDFNFPLMQLAIMNFAAKNEACSKDGARCPVLDLSRKRRFNEDHRADESR